MISQIITAVPLLSFNLFFSFNQYFFKYLAAYCFKDFILQMVSHRTSGIHGMSCSDIEATETNGWLKSGKWIIMLQNVKLPIRLGEKKSASFLNSEIVRSAKM